jgi:hypothetical protein
MASSGMLRLVALVRTDVSEERIASIIRLTRIGELGTTIAISIKRNRLRSSTMAMRSSETSLLKKRHGVTAQKKEFFIVAVVKTSNLAYLFPTGVFEF